MHAVLFFLPAQSVGEGDLEAVEGAAGANNSRHSANAGP
jgi:hypothetical protein